MSGHRSSADRRLMRSSKFLSLILRHKPEVVGVSLDPQGWIAIDELLEACARHGRPISREELARVVAQNDKQRFTIREGRIRANQGHSIAVDLQLEERVPPALLFHGTAERFLASILSDGLQKRARHHVHLSPDAETARRVGARHGRPMVLRIRAGEMQLAGHTFFRSENGVWLTETVPPNYIERA